MLRTTCGVLPAADMFRMLTPRVDASLNVLVLAEHGDNYRHVYSSVQLFIVSFLVGRVDDNAYRALETRRRARLTTL